MLHGIGCCIGLYNRHQTWHVGLVSRSSILNLIILVRLALLSYFMSFKLLLSKWIRVSSVVQWEVR